MKNIFIAICLFFALNTSAQSVAINTDGSTADASALLDLKSTNQGVLVPRMTAAQRGLIASPATGLMVYQTDAPAGFYFYNGTAWAVVGGSSSSGATLDLLATKTTGSQILPTPNTTTVSGDLVTFNNVVTTPTLGTYNTATSEYTVGISGVYLIQAFTRSLDHPTPSQTTSQYIFVDVDNAGIASANTILPTFTALGTNLPLGTKGIGFTSVVLPLTVGQKVRIVGLNNNTSTAGQPLKTDQSCKFTVVKL